MHKLTHLMWSEQCCTVRLAAAEALMKLGKMQHVHSELRYCSHTDYRQHADGGSVLLVLSSSLLNVFTCTTCTCRTYTYCGSANIGLCSWLSPEQVVNNIMWWEEASVVRLTVEFYLF